MKIWGVTFSYETPGERVLNIAKTVYKVVEERREDAVAKAYADFSKTQCFSDLNLSIEGRVKTTANIITSSKIKFPELTLQNDQEEYKISVRISKDGSSLEYIVLEE